jgi:hypothetical protein
MKLKQEYTLVSIIIILIIKKLLIGEKNNENTNELYIH